MLGKLINDSLYWKNAIIYILNGMQGDDKEVLRRIKGLNKNIIDNVMEVLKRRERRGFERGQQQGIKIGKRRGMRFFVGKFLNSGMSKFEIAEKLDIVLIQLEEILAEAIDRC